MSVRPAGWRTLCWVAALSPGILFVVFLVTSLFFLDGEVAGGGDAASVTATMDHAIGFLRWWFRFAFYLAAPLWSAVMVHPSLRPAPTQIGAQIMLFGGGWFAWFCCVEIDRELARCIFPLL